MLCFEEGGAAALEGNGMGCAYQGECDECFIKTHHITFGPVNTGGKNPAGRHMKMKDFRERGRAMKKRNKGLPYGACLFLTLMLWMPGLSHGGDGIPKTRVPKGVYIDLTQDFYETLREESGSGTKVYSNDPSSEYLRQIAVSTKFIVETNLQILRLQEEIIRLLDTRSGQNRK